MCGNELLHSITQAYIPRHAFLSYVPTPPPELSESRLSLDILVLLKTLIKTITYQLIFPANTEFNTTLNTSNNKYLGSFKLHIHRQYTCTLHKRRRVHKGSFRYLR